MRVCTLATVDDWSTFGIDLKSVTWLNGEGSFGCLFQAKYESGKDVVVKVLFPKISKSDKTFEENKEIVRKDALKEAFIGHSLATMLEPVIAGMFVETLAIAHTENGLPTEFLTALKSNPVCNDKKTDYAWILVQRFVSSTPMDKWLMAQTAAVNAEVIRSFLFQAVLALSYANHKLGFQHNDVKMENIMVTKVDKETPLVYRIGEMDTFRCVIPKDGLVVQFIDFGGSDIILANDDSILPKYLLPSGITTPGFSPLDRPDISVLLVERKNDADMTGLFIIAMNMIAHNRKEVTPAGLGFGATFWKYTAKMDYVTSMITGLRFKDMKSVTEEPYQRLFQKVGFVSNSAGEKVVKHAVVFMDMCQELFGEESTNERVKKISGPIGELFNSSAVSALRRGFTFKEVPLLFETCFTKKDKASELALSFFKCLFEPLQAARQAFGVPTPFDKYGLANALYHPFLGYHYWKYNETTGDAIDEIGQPLADMTGADADAARMRIRTAANALERMLAELEGDAEESEGVDPGPAAAAALQNVDLKQCANEMRVLAVNHFAAKPLVYFAVPNSPLLPLFQNCIDSIALSYDKTNATATEYLKELKIIDADGKANTVTTDTGTGFYFTPYFKDLQGRAVKKGIFAFEEISINAAIVLLGLYVTQQLTDWENVLKLKKDMDTPARNPQVNSTNVEKWVTEKLGELFDENTAASGTLQPSGKSDSDVNVVTIKSLMEKVTANFFNGKDRVPDVVNGADILAMSQISEQFGEIYDGLPAKVKTKLVAHSGKPLLFPANMSMLHENKIKRFVIGVGTGKNDELVQNDGQPKRDQNLSHRITLIDDISPPAWSGPRAYFVLGGLLFMMKLMLSTLTSTVFNLNVQEAMNDASGRKKETVGKIVTTVYRDGVSAMTSYKALINQMIIEKVQGLTPVEFQMQPGKAFDI